MQIFYRRTIQNVAIFFLMFIGIKNFIISLPLRYSPHFKEFYNRIDIKDTMFLHGSIAFIVSLVMILLAYNLYKRIRSAWIGEIVVLVISIILQIIYFHALAIHMIVIETLILIILLVSADDFSRVTHIYSFKKSLRYIFASFLLLFINSSIGIYLIHGSISNVSSLRDSFSESFHLLVFMDKSVLSSSGKIMNLYADSIISLFWISTFMALIFALKPITLDYFKNKGDKEKVHEMVLKYGQNPMSYLALEDDKSYFFGSYSEGVCAYTIVGNVMVICGDMICSENSGIIFLNEIMIFSKINHYDLVFLNVTDVFLDLYKTAQFGCLKYGEDACFKLEDYTLKGGSVAKVRAAINHANKMGIQVQEYIPANGVNSKLEKEIQVISSEWFKSKSMPEMQFMLGGIGLSSPMERRYFYAIDSNDLMLGFVVFLPYLNGKAYLADVTRRKGDAPQGVLEKIIYEAFMIMKDEGVLYGNMGLSPLFNVDDNSSQNISAKVSEYIYDNLNAAYNFKLLHHSKEKYAPTHWESRYIAYYPKPMSLKYAYAIVKAQNPVNIYQLIKNQFIKPL